MDQFGMQNQGGVQSPFNSFKELMEAQKSMDAGAPVPSYSGGGVMAPLLVQSIEMTLTQITSQAEDAAFWSAFPKDSSRINNTVHEYRRQTDLGYDIDGFSVEGAVGPSVDASFESLYAKCKFFTHKRVVTHVAGQFGPVIGANSAIEKANIDASNWQTRQLDAALLWGDEDLNPQMFNGIVKTCETQGNVLDNRGQALDTAGVRNIISTLRVPPNYGNPNKMWISVETQNDLDALVLPHVRYNVPQGDVRMMAKVATGIQAPVLNGYVPFAHDIFLSPDFKKLVTGTAFGEVQPATPTASVAFAAGAPTVPGTSEWAAGDAGNYIYKIRAVGAKGKSAVLTSGTIAVVAGQTVKVTLAAPGVDNVLYYEIFRTEKGGSDFYLIDRVKQVAGPGATPYEDLNEYLPNTTWAFVVQEDPRVFVWKQLLDFFRIQLAMVDLNIPFAYGLYGMPLWLAPERLYAIKNIARAT